MVVKSDLLGAARLALVPSKYLGLFPYIESAGVYKVSPRAMALSVFLCLSSFLTLCFNFYSEKLPENDLFNAAELFIMNLVVIISLYESTKSLGSLSECLESLEEVEEGLNALGRRSNFNCEFRHTFFNIAFGFGTVVFKFSTYILIADNTLRNLFQLILFSIMLAQMIVLVQRYSGLLGIATDLLLSCKKEITTTYRYSSAAAIKRLEDLVEIHCRLCVTSVKLNDCQELQILAVIFSCLVICIAESYKTILHIESSELTHITLSIINFCGITVYFNMSHQIVRACKLTSLEAKEFNDLLYQLMLDDRTTILSTNKKLRLHFAMKREIVFTACGFFKLDYTLIHSMVAAATTYLVILIQFQQSSTSESISPNSSTS